MGDNIEDFLDRLPQDQANAFLDLALRSQILCTSIYGDQIVQTTTIGNQTVETTFINPKDPKAEKADSVYSLPEGYSLNGDRFAVPDGFHVVELNKMDNFKDVQSQFPGLTISKDGKIRDDVTGLQMCVIKNDVTGEISFVTAGLDGPHTLFKNDKDDILNTMTGVGVGDQFPEFKMIVDSVIEDNPNATYSFNGHSLGAVMSELYIAQQVQKEFITAIQEKYGKERFDRVLAELNPEVTSYTPENNELAAALIIAKENGYPTDLNIDMSKFSGLVFENYGSVNNFWSLAEQENDFSKLLSRNDSTGSISYTPYKDYLNSLIASNTNIISIQSDSEVDIMGNSIFGSQRFSEVLEVHKDYAPDSPVAQHAVFTFYSALEECSEELSVVASVEGTVEGHAKAEASRTGRR